MGTPIIDMISEYARQGATRFHMPGHKGKHCYFGGSLLSGDITELSFSDNLLMPAGVISEAERNHAIRVGAESTLFSVNGSSAGVMASIVAAVSEGQKIICARDMHLSAVNALCLSGAKPAFIGQPDGLFPYPSFFSMDEFEHTLSKNQDACAVFITYPNFYGGCVHLRRICESAHEAGMAVIVDSAHGAHFPYSAELPESAGECGADVWTVSAHKTLPAMNQCAYVNIGYNTLVDEQKLKRALAMFTTTSPSYLLLASLDYASDYMERCGEEEILRVVSLVELYERKIDSIYGLKVLSLADLDTSVYDKDPLRMVIDVSGRGYTGIQVKDYLEQRNILIECADARCIVLICTVADDREDFEALFEALNTLGTGERTEPIDQYYYPKLKSAMTPREALLQDEKVMPVTHCEGKIAAQPIGMYPPGVPIVMPGEEITKETLKYLFALNSIGFELFGIQEQNISTVEWENERKDALIF